MKTEKGRICVFGASSAEIDKAYIDAARELGQLLARSGWQCVNGGGSKGLMRAVSDGTLDAGGHVVGVIPKFMVDNNWQYDRLADMVVTADMHQRKSLMLDMSDAVIALPGGVGTLEELLEAITWRQLNLHHLPIVLLNTNGFFNALVEMLGHSIAEGFMKPTHARLFRLADSAREAIERVEEELSDGPRSFEPKN